MQLYKYENKISAAEKRIADANYSTKNKELIFEFENTIFAEGLSNARILKYLSQLHMLSQMFDKDFSKVIKADFYRVVASIERSDRSVYTKRDYKVAIKRFFRWLNDGNEPESITWISTNITNAKKKMPEELLTQSEVISMIEAADHPRDKAIISSWYDSGGRVGEVGTMLIKHIVFDQYGATATMQGKTGMRKIRLVLSVPYLAAWLSAHPYKNDPEAPVWITIGKSSRNQPLQYDAQRILVQRIAKKAGIKKRVYPHLFRHSRATELASHLTQAQMESHLGWIHGSNMPGTYIHLSGKGVDDAILGMYGIKKDKEPEQDLIPWKCFTCEILNPITSKFCSRCGAAKDTKTAMDTDQNEFTVVQKYARLKAQYPEVFEEIENIE